jgi:hypothetical protein
MLRIGCAHVQTRLLDCWMVKGVATVRADHDWLLSFPAACLDHQIPLPFPKAVGKGWTPRVARLTSLISENFGFVIFDFYNF